MSRRIERVNNLIRQEISELLQRQAKDPRLGGFVTVTQVSTSPDLRHAKVFVSIIGTEEQEKEILEVLTTASGFLRKEISGRLRLRHCPALSFHYDHSLNKGAEILQLINQVAAAESGENGPSEC